MSCPSPLKPGDLIALVSVAGIPSKSVVEAAAQLLGEDGFKVRIYPHAFDKYRIYAGLDSDRASDMQSALDDPEVKAIFFTRGGYGSLRTFQLLDWRRFFSLPKWLVGFSDITIFHAFLTVHQTVSMHGTMTAFFQEEGVRTGGYLKMMEMLQGHSSEIALPAHQLNRNGSCSGILAGGNLTLLMSVRGTPLDPDYSGKVLFIEDIGEFDYHIDRMMMNLKASGILQGLAGLVVGYFTDTKSGQTPYGLNAEEIIKEAVEEFDYPVVFGFPAGHEQPNFPLLMGAPIHILVTGEKVIVEQSFPVAE